MRSVSQRTSKDRSLCEPSKARVGSFDAMSARDLQVVSRTAQGGAAAAARRERFDYAEQVDTLSSMSTPNSTAELSNPFAKEPLGDTVIHLDKVSFSTCESTEADNTAE